MERETYPGGGPSAPLAANPLQKQPAQRGPGRPFRPGQSGNPEGRRPGTRNGATLFAEALLEGEAEALVRKAVERALLGDAAALRLCIERILTLRRDRPVRFHLPPLQSADDASRAVAAILNAAAEGELAPSEAAELSGVVATYLRAQDAHDFERRLKALEERQGESDA